MSLSKFYNPILTLGPSFFSKFVTIEKWAISQAFKIMPLSRPWIFSYSVHVLTSNSLSTRGAYYGMNALLQLMRFDVGTFSYYSFFVLDVCGDNGWVGGGGF